MTQWVEENRHRPSTLRLFVFDDTNTGSSLKPSALIDFCFVSLPEKATQQLNRHLPLRLYSQPSSHPHSLKLPTVSRPTSAATALLEFVFGANELLHSYSTVPSLWGQQSGTRTH